jgi:hypothetical protein
MGIESLGKTAIAGIFFGQTRGQPCLPGLG